jgi:hypothetical protein
MFDSPTANDDYTRRVVKAITGKRRNALLAAILYRHRGELRTCEGDLRRVLDGIGHWNLACYVNKGTRDILIRLENEKGAALHADSSNVT